MSQQENSTGWVKLFTPENALVTIPVDLATVITPEQANTILCSVRNLCLVGFSVTEKGLEEGELTLTAAMVARRTSSNENAPIIDFYDAHPKVEKKVIHSYLNDPEDIQQFEMATGVRLADIPEWDGDIAIAKNHAKASRYIVKLAQPVKIVYRISQKWLEWNAADPKPKKEPMKKILVRYETNGVTPPATDQPKPDQPKPVKMTFAIACEVKSPAGNGIGTLTRDQLEQLSISQATNVTDQMRDAAKLILSNIAAPQGTKA
jgi:hypothetical protein